LLLPVDLIRLLVNPFLKKKKEIVKTWNARLILLMYIFFAVYVPLRIFYDINFVEVRHTEYSMEDLPESLQGFKIGLIADIQADYYTDENRLNHYIDKLNEAEPDLVLIAGDVITNSAEYIPVAAEALSKIKSEYGIYACVGDHDNWAYGRNIMKSRREVIETLDRKSIYMLDDVNYKLAIDSSIIGITFITDTYSDRISHSLLDSLTTNLHGSDLRILLSHQPNYKIVQRAIDNKYNLMLSGHTHGGQITILFPFQDLSPTMFETKYVRGDFWFDNTMLVVCRGLGFSIAPVRFNSTPEVVIIELNK
jgi:predicted MPP superfamily phosphohydrolase